MVVAADAADVAAAPPLFGRVGLVAAVLLCSSGLLAAVPLLSIGGLTAANLLCVGGFAAAAAESRKVTDFFFVVSKWKALHDVLV